MRILQGIISILISISLMLSIFSFIEITHAAGNCSGTSDSNAADFLKGCSVDNDYGAITPASGDSASSIKTLVKKVAERAVAFGALFAVGALVWSGIQYNIAYGDDEKIKKAKTTGIYALIGLFLLLVAFPMVNIVVEFVYNTASK